VVFPKDSDPLVLEFVVSNITENNQWENCISLDFYLWLKWTTKLAKISTQRLIMILQYISKLVCMTCVWNKLYQDGATYQQHLHIELYVYIYLSCNNIPEPAFLVMIISLIEDCWLQNEGFLVVKLRPSLWNSYGGNSYMITECLSQLITDIFRFFLVIIMWFYPRSWLITGLFTWITNKTGTTCGTGTAFTSGTHQFITGFSGFVLLTL